MAIKHIHSIHHSAALWGQVPEGCHWQTQLSDREMRSGILFPASCVRSLLGYEIAKYLFLSFYERTLGKNVPASNLDGI